MSAREVTIVCPAPAAPDDTVQLAHGGGGRRMHALVEGVFRAAFGTGDEPAHDSAVLPATRERLAFTTDSYVVQPRWFPGGDIGRLAVHGTVNDLAMAGATPRWLSAGFILEEGLPIDELRRVAASMRAAADACGVVLCTGDTKVVHRGQADGLFINTSGVGTVPDGIEVHPRRVRPGDAILVSGDVGRHGIAVMSVREGLAFETPVDSDCAPLHGLVQALQNAGVDVHCLRDATRGGLATVACELARDAAVGIELDERAVPVGEAVAGACELLGLDPMYVACEGRLVAIVPASQAELALATLRRDPLGREAACIGRVMAAPAGRVLLHTVMGSRRPLELPWGEQLPRIC